MTIMVSKACMIPQHAAKIYADWLLPALGECFLLISCLFLCSGDTKVHSDSDMARENFLFAQVPSGVDYLRLTDVSKLSLN